MLQDFSELADQVKKNFESIQKWPEIEFNAEDQAMIRTLDGVTEVSTHSFQMGTGYNHAVINGQYVLYAVWIKELALAVKEHLDLFDNVRATTQNKIVAEALLNRRLEIGNFPLDEYSKRLAFQIFYEPKLHQGAKSIVNGSPGNYSLRGTSDYFSSIILKPINIPAASSSIVGKLIFKLTENRKLYDYLEHRFLHQLPYVLKESKTNRFVKRVLSFLFQYDGLEGFYETFTEMTPQGRVSVKDDEFGLTSIFKLSPTPLNEQDLLQGEKPRFFKEPLYLDSNGNFVYLSTEWTDGTDSRLDLVSFKMWVEKYYPDFVIAKVDDAYVLQKQRARSSSGSYQTGMLQINRFFADLGVAGINIGEGTVSRFFYALLTKPFVILTGLSGSGKTKLATSFSSWICSSQKQWKIVAVGADWTNRDPLLGYPDALRPREYVKPDNGVLDLIIDAGKDPENPYFLILDEMNLSHVERYFADFLSAMELSGDNRSISLHSNPEDTAISRKLSLPKNLFIVGTVNIDETTYMFSPKVLDRANVIEFRIDPHEMKAFLSSPTTLDLDALVGKGSGMAKDFVRLSKEPTNLPTVVKTDLSEELNRFFAGLQTAGAEFGYRSASEILRFAYMVNRLEPDKDLDWIMDAAIMQKLLPKLHGSRRKLIAVLETLASFCWRKDPVNLETFTKEPAQPNFKDLPNCKYPLSLEKLYRMYKNLGDNGFTSYAEA